MKASLLFLTIFLCIGQSTSVELAPEMNSKLAVSEIPIKIIQNASQYYTIANSKDNWVVVLYEKWCGYSQITLKMLDVLRKNPDFIKTGVSHLKAVV